MKLDKKAIFTQLFRIFEKEFKEILEYIAPLKENYGTTGNKIHELHMRICSELENVLLELTSINWKEKIEERKTTQKKPYVDFSDYLYILDKEIDISNKKIKFLADLEIQEANTIRGFNKGIFLQPFGRTGELGDGNIPNWWKIYNGLKHDKFNFYDKCNLGNVRDALAAYYLALLYYIFGYNTELYISKIPYNDPTKNNAYYKKAGGSINFEENVECELFGITACALESEITEIINGRVKLKYKKDGKLKPYENGLPVKECLFYSYVNAHEEGIIKFVNNKTNN